jgi:hypothetical protein
MKEEEKSTSPKYEGNERTQELLGDGLRLCKLASFYQRNHILVRSSSCWDTEWTMMAHPPTHTHGKQIGASTGSIDNTHHPPRKKNGDCNVRTVREFLISKGKARIVINQPSCLCVCTYMCIRRENLIEVKAGRDEFFRFLFFIFVWTSSPSSKKRWNNQHDTVQLRSYTYTVSTTSENVKVSFFFLFVCCAFFQLGHVL